MQMVRTASRFRLAGLADVPFKRMSGSSLARSLARTQARSLAPRVTNLTSSLLFSHLGGFRFHRDRFGSEGFCGQTSAQPAGTNQRLEWQSQNCVVAFSIKWFNNLPWA